jgi:hypothetical protein
VNEFVMLDAAIWREHPRFDAVMRHASVVPLYADLPSANARLFGPWLLEAAALDAIELGDEPVALPWRYGVSHLAAAVDLTDLVAHFESQRSIAMAAGDRYYLRYADTRALSTLERVLTSHQMHQLKGPVARWRYVDRFGNDWEFGAEVPADSPSHDMIILSEAQSAALLELQLAQVLADEVCRRTDGKFNPQLDPAQYLHVEACAVFVLENGIDSFDAQRHITAVAVQTGGALLENAQFLDQVKSLRVSGRWHELMNWRMVSGN